MKKNPPIEVDEARLRPHLRKQKPRPIVQPDNGTGHIQTFNGPGMPRARSNDGLMVDPRELRGIPVVGRGVGGSSPGTRPDHAVDRLDPKERAA